jgi:hypothetical protein
MTEIITTKDLTKNELSLAKILTAGILLVGLVVFLNFAKMEDKEFPEITFLAGPSQSDDVSGQVSFSLNITKLANYENKLKLEYTLDNENYQPIKNLQTEIESGSLLQSETDEYQISGIESEAENAILNFVWDLKAGEQIISSDNVKIRATLSARLKIPEQENSNLNTSPENTNQVGEPEPGDNEPVIIDAEQAVIGSDVQIIDEESDSETQEPIAEPEVVESVPQDNQPVPEAIPSENVTEIMNTVVATFLADSGENNAEEVINNIDESSGENIEIPEENENIETEIKINDWREISVVSKNFKIDNKAPQVRSGQVNLEKGEIYIYFNEKISADTPVANGQILLQNEILAESAFSWLNDFILLITLSATEKVKYVGPITDWVLQLTEDNSIMDSHYNRFPGALVTLTEQKGDPLEFPYENEDEENKDEEKPEEEKEEEIIIPQNNKIINTRGYNKNCSFNPDELIMSAGTVGQVDLNLIPLDSESKYVLTANTLPNAFDVKILKPSGTGAGPIKLEVTAPANALPRLYKLLIKYKDITPQSVSYVHNCVLRLTVQ